MIRLCLLLYFVAVLTTFARPRQVIIIRHAEKPESNRDVHLSSRGWERARALVSIFSTNANGRTVAVPDVLVAARRVSWSNSARPVETLSPLSRALGIPVLTPFQGKDYAELASDLLTNSAYADKIVLVCWVQDYIREFAEALGARKAPKWKSEQFDRVWVIGLSGRKPSFKELPQKLLPGDKE